MKSIFHLLLCCLSLTFLACEEPSFEEPEPRERTYLHFINAFDGYSGVDLQVETLNKTQFLFQNLGFMEVWPRGGYASLLTVPKADSSQILKGDFIISVFNHTSPATPISTKKLTLNPDIRTTLALVDSFGKPILVKTIDSEPKFSGDDAQVRFMNVNDANLSVSLTTTDTDFQIANLNFLNYSSFHSLKKGVYSFYFVNDFSGTILDSISNMSIERGLIYNFFMANRDGKPVAGVEKLE